jgi:hypothetical protein
MGVGDVGKRRSVISFTKSFSMGKNVKQKP